MQNWFYARGSQRNGPISLEQLKNDISAGRVRATDLAWTTGMPQWRPVGEIAELNNPATVAAPALAAMPVAVSAPAPIAQASAPAQQISYFQPSMPPRAVENLRGHAGPRGDVGTWPLDDALFAQIKEAMKLRKRIYGAAQLYRGLFGLTIITTAIFAIVGLASFATGSRASAAAMGIGALVATLICAAFSVFYWLIWRFSMRSHRWAPLSFLIVFLVLTLVDLLGLASIMGRGQTPPEVMVGPVISVVLLALFGWISLRAYMAIPKYLSYPAWCQELIAAAGL